jgi:ribosomal protein S3
MNQAWKSKYFEKNIQESHTYIFKSLEIKQYLQKILKDQGLTLHKYQLNFSDASLNIFISLHRTEQASLINKKKQSRALLDKKLIKLKRKIKRHWKENHLLNKTSTRVKFAQTLKLYKTYLDRLGARTSTRSETFKLESFSNKILKSLNIFTDNKFNINLTVQEINSINKAPESQQILLKLRKFERTSFFTEGKNLLIPFITQNNSARLLTNFIANQLKTIKRHNFFFNFLKESLHLTINQRISKIQGIKIIIKGRLNNAARAKHRIITIGKIPLTTISSSIDYSESTAFTSNGTMGVRVWIAEKRTKKDIDVLTTKKN